MQRESALVELYSEDEKILSVFLVSSLLFSSL